MRKRGSVHHVKSEQGPVLGGGDRAHMALLLVTRDRPSSSARCSGLCREHPSPARALLRLLTPPTPRLPAALAPHTPGIRHPVMRATCAHLAVGGPQGCLPAHPPASRFGDLPLPSSPHPPVQQHPGPQDGPCPDAVTHPLYQPSPLTVLDGAGGVEGVNGGEDPEPWMRSDDRVPTLL